MELSQLYHPELKLSNGDTGRARAPATLSEVLRELRTGAAESGECRVLVEVLSSEDRLLSIGTTEINKLLRKARATQEQWRAIKSAKRKIRKKVNKRASDGRSKSREKEGERALSAARWERQELLEEIAGLERECEFYLTGMERLRREWHSNQP